jgi:putative DNA primase/helicase
LSRIVKGLIDPSSLELRSLPRNLQDLSISAANSWLLNFDNVSSIPDNISDALCRLSTGGGFATRTLYSNRDETLFSVQRPFMLNGINAEVNREDLVDRMILLSMAKIPEENRRSEREFWQGFSGEAPAILGAILDAVSCSLRNYRSVKLSYLPRMADFAIWVTAAEPTLGWEPRTFLKEYSRNRAEASSQIVAASIVLSTVLDFMKSRKKLVETPTELHDSLGSYISEEARRSRQWPKSPNHLSRILSRGAEPLKQEGVAISSKRTGAERLWVLENLQKKVMTGDGNTQLTLGRYGKE